MVTRWGMGGLGLTAFQADAEHPFLGGEWVSGREYSEATAARVDADVEQVLAACHDVVYGLLSVEEETRLLPVSECGGA